MAAAQTSSLRRGRPPCSRPARFAATAWRRVADCLRLLLLLILFPPLPAAGAGASPAAPLARAGVLELSADAATRNTRLAGRWSFAWRRFVDPRAPGTWPATAMVPGSWNGVTADGKPVGPDGFGSYGLEIRCPAGQRLALFVPTQRTAMRLYVNGTLAVVQGEPGTSPHAARPAIGPRAMLTAPYACPLHIVVHVSNWSHREGGMVRSPVAGPIGELARDDKQRLALDTLLLGAYAVLGLLPMLFFVARPKERHSLLFGLFCLAQAVYADTNGERLLLQLATPETPWEVFLRIDYLSWFASMALYGWLVLGLFPRALDARIVGALLAACALAMVGVAATPGRVYSEFVVYGQALGLVLAGYIVLGMARAARRAALDALLILGGLAMLGAVIASNVLDIYAGPGQRALAVLGQLLFVLSPGIVSLRRVARTLTAEEFRAAEQREKADLLVRATQAGILDWDDTRKVTRYSPRLLEILGYPPDTDTSGWPPIFERIHPLDRAWVQDTFLAQLRDRSVKGGEMRHAPQEYRLLRRDGSLVWVHAEAISLRAANGRTLRYICSFLDITDQRAVAEGLKRQNAALAENARLREDVERMSRHDLKTPLNSIIGVARLLREDAAVQPEHRELAAIAERAGFRMLEMVNLSLDLSRMELGTYDFRPQAVNVVDVIARVVQDLQGLAQAMGVAVRIESEAVGPVYARAEELLCYSILANLLKNAIEATAAGGEVKVALEPGDPVHVRVHNPARVPPRVEQRFFDKYVTAGKAGGTGLGTYSARLMARVQRGELEMRTGDAGTVLTLSLRALGSEPLPPPPQQQAAMVAPPPGEIAPARVLVVDDDEYNRLLLLRYLPPPFAIEAAANGQQAIEAAAKHWPDIVLVDLQMPVMNGLEAVRWLRDEEARTGRKRCLVVMMSSNDDAESIRAGLAAGSDRYLAKPFTREALLAVLQELRAGGPPVSWMLPASGAGGPSAPAQPLEAVHVDPELLPEVPAFLDSRRAMVQGMAAALARGDRAQLRTVAHRAAGGLALFGFRWAAWQSRRICTRAVDADPHELQQEIERLREHLDHVQVE